MTGTHVSSDTNDAATDDSAGQSLEARLADRTRELDEMTRQHAATVEILDIIAQSAAGLQPVLDAVVRTAVRHCGADDSSIILREGATIFAAAHEGPLPSTVGTRQPIERSRFPARVILDGQTIHAPDTGALDRVDFAATVALSQEFGIFAMLGAPIRHAGEVIGCLLLRRREVGPFSARQIAMLETLATQAGIAVANAGLIGELREALEQQTATAEILRAITHSPTDFKPVLDAVVKAAVQFCGATDAIISLRDGDSRIAAAHAGNLGFVARRLPLDRASGSGRAIIEARTVHTPDIDNLDPVEFPETRKFAALHGFRASLAAPLMRGGIAIGSVALRKPTPDPFKPREIALLEAFAAQAVIAIENVRLFTELNVSLEQQTATSEILRIISRSPTDVQPVLDALVVAARRFCGGEDAVIRLRDGNFAVRRAHDGVIETTLGHRVPLDRTSSMGRAMVDRQTVHHPDVTLLDPKEYPTALALTREMGLRATVVAPMVSEGVAVGAVMLRRRTPGAFTPRQIELLETFAAQAVIAIENVRLFTELNESLEQQTATSEILKIISRSLTDVRPVLDAVVETAARFCGAEDVTMALRDGDHWVGAAHVGPIQAVTGERIPLTRETIMGRALIDSCAMHVPDIERLDPVEFAAGRALSARLGLRAMFVAPMMREGVAIGGINLRRATPGPFTARQIELAESLASQAVIAIENVRLFTEQREALEQQTATAEILRAISQSPTDVQPVLDAVVKAALRFCGATDAIIVLREGEGAFFAAHEGPLAPAPGASIPLNRETAPGRAIVDGRTCHFPDIASLDPVEFAAAHRLAAAQGFRAAVAAPLLREGSAIGAVALRKSVVGPFAPQQIELLETFAAQAVIAIENVRLFTELKEALEQQIATAEVLETINGSPGDPLPVFETILAKAMTLCDAAFGTFAVFDGQRLVTVATRGVPEAFAAYRRANPPAYGPATGPGRLMAGEDIVHEIDVANSDAYRLGDSNRRAIVDLGGARTILNIALRKDRALLGSMSIYNQQVRPFTEKQIALLQNFAAQAVIAMENARLLTEQREALERQTAMADILNVISRSPTDVQPVLEAIAKAAVRFCGAPDAIVTLRENDETVVRAHEGILTATLGLRRAIGDGGNVGGQAMREKRTLQVADVMTLDPVLYAGTIELARRHNWRATATAPLLRDGEPIGLIILRKPEPGILPSNQIALLETFAAQAVIAIENVRLFTELRDSLEQQTATADILRVISQSPTDIQPVLDAVAKAAVRFCGASDALISLREGDERVAVAHEGNLGFVESRFGLDRNSGSGRAIVDARTIHLPDIQALDPDDYPESRVFAARNGFRASLTAPLLRQGVAIGAVALRKPEPGPFTLQQIELLETFAAQAVIAIENVRLFTELRESLERLKAAQANLIQSEKMASLGQLTAGIAHEIKNPLNFVNNFATLSVELLDELKEAAGPALATLGGDRRAELDETMELLTGNLAKIAEHGKRADGIVRSMLSHSRGGTGDWQAANVNGLVDEALNLAYHGARAQDPGFNVTLERDLAADTAPIEIVPQDLTRVFLNLFANGFYATRKRHLAGAGPGYHPSLAVRTRDLGDSVEIRVRDNGTGIPPEVRDRLFQPFFTTKPTGEGTGLGLSISWDIVTQQHGGTITVDSEPGEWTEFIIRLPRGRRGAEAARVER